MTTVSVVMPVRNEEKSVAGAIASVLSQSFQDLELLVVDGDSSDRTREIVGRIADQEPRVRLLANPQRTIPHALNIGLREARGRYLARVDAHASVNDTYLEIGVKTLDADPDVAAVGGRRIGVAATLPGVACATALSSRFGVGDSINHYATVPQDTDHASFGVFRVDVLRAVGGWDENLLVNEDVDIDHRILGLGHRIRFDPDMCIYWHVRESVPALARQYRRYGRGKAAMVRKNGADAVRVRHLAPPALVVALGAAGVAAVGAVAGATVLWPVTAVLAGPYALAVVGATAATLRTAEPVGYPGVPGSTGTPVPPDGLAPATTGDGTTRSGGGRTGEPPTVGSAAGTPREALAEAVAAPGGDPVERRHSGATPLGVRRPNPFTLAGAFMAMHLGWGLGFLEGGVLGLTPAAASSKDPRPSRPSSGAAGSSAH